MTASGWGTGPWGTMGWGGDDDTAIEATERIDVAAVASLSSSTRAFHGTSVFERPKSTHGKPT